MIRSLRRRHRIMIIVLSIVLPVLFVAGLLARRPVAMMKDIPASLTASGGEPDEP